jgi:hypothetical protein
MAGYYIRILAANGENKGDGAEFSVAEIEKLIEKYFEEHF